MIALRYVFAMRHPFDPVLDARVDSNSHRRSAFTYLSHFSALYKDVVIPNKTEHMYDAYYQCQGSTFFKTPPYPILGTVSRSLHVRIHTHQWLTRLVFDR